MANGSRVMIYALGLSLKHYYQFVPTIYFVRVRYRQDKSMDVLKNVLIFEAVSYSKEVHDLDHIIALDSLPE